jgi:hypothetical protein
MRVRALDQAGDWLFGKGQQDYLVGLPAIEQNIQTRILFVLNDCFFAMAQGIDWFNLLGGKNQLALNLAVSTTILNTDLVTGLVQLSVVLDATRKLTISYVVNTALSGQANTTLAGSIDFLVTEAGDFIVDESGNVLEI